MDEDWILHVGGPVAGESLRISLLPDGRLPPERVEADPDHEGVLHRYHLVETRSRPVYVWEGHA